MEGGAMARLLWIVTLTSMYLPGHATLLAPEPGQHVYKVTVNEPGASRESCGRFPDTLHVDISASDPFPQSLVLYRKDVINTEVPVYVLRSDANGIVYTERVESDGEQTAAYQNPECGASFLVKCTNGNSYSIAGTMYIEGHKYRVRHQSQLTSSWEMATSLYEFAYVNDTFHHDNKLQGNLGRPIKGSTNLDLSSDRSRSARAKRETREEYYIDVLVALDYAFYQFWFAKAGNDSDQAVQQAKEYIAYIFNDINTRYSSIDHSTWRLNILLTGFIIAKTPGEAPWTEEVKTAADGGHQVEASAVLTRLKDYVKDHYNTLPKHDHLMLITEYDLYGDDNGFRFNNTAGYAYIGTTCRGGGESVSVVEDHGGFQSETTATHELGHSLGANHDGDGNTCNSDDRYVMSGDVHPVTEANKLHPWRFSSCSEDAFDDYIKKLIKDNLSDCLTERLNSTDVPTVDGYPGKFHGPDDQCRQIYGSKSYLCRGTNFGTPEEICLSMYCRNPATKSSCTLNTAAPGTCCGNQKWCIEGKCVDAPNSTCYMSATCPFGQRQGVVFENKTCDHLESGNCYDEDFRLVCCEMCDRQRTNVANCQYGDLVRNCHASNCGLRLSVTNELYDVECCGTCNYDAGGNVTVPTPVEIPQVPDEVVLCRDTHLLNNQQCRIFLKEHGTGHCCNSTIRDVCCKACQAIERQNNDPSCPYGDCRACENVLTSPVRCSDALRVICCRTCQQVDKKLSLITTTTEKEKEEECRVVQGTSTCGAEGAMFPGAGRWMRSWAAAIVVVRVVAPIVFGFW